MKHYKIFDSFMILFVKSNETKISNEIKIVQLFLRIRNKYGLIKILSRKLGGIKPK